MADQNFPQEKFDFVLLRLDVLQFKTRKKFRRVFLCIADLISPMFIGHTSLFGKDLDFVILLSFHKESGGGEEVGYKNLIQWDQSQMGDAKIENNSYIYN